MLAYGLDWLHGWTVTPSVNLQARAAGQKEVVSTRSERATSSYLKGSLAYAQCEQ